MPFTFVDIEERKTKLIWFLFGFLVLFYFFGAWLIALTLRVIFFLQISDTYQSHSIFHLSQQSYLAIFLIALAAGIMHWFISLDNCTDRILNIMEAQAPDKDDTCHQVLQNIVDEVIIATGGKKIDCVVVPISAMNAFSVADFKGNSFIGVTEGLIARLSRPQLEAVIAHEAAHIVMQDTLIKTVAVSLFSIYGAISERLSDAFNTDLEGHCHSRGRGIHYVIILYLVTTLLYGMSKLISMFISRQCEYRADAVAVRLVRDPLSLGQALYKIGRGWRAGGMGYDMLESLFIMNPNLTSLDESEGFFSDLFSTHPPVLKRIDRLLELGHSDLFTLSIDAEKTTRPRHIEVSPTAIHEPGWLFSHNGRWEGPFTAKQITSLDWLNPETFIKREGADSIGLLWQDTELSRILGKGGVSSGAFDCPRCRQALSKVLYEGVPIYRCDSCKGVLVDEGKLPRILAREEQGFSDEIIRRAKIVRKTADGPLDVIKARLKHDLPCPKCKDMMLSHLYTYTYPIEVDTCLVCKLTWYDKDELEILQYLIEESVTKKWG